MTINIPDNEKENITKALNNAIVAYKRFINYILLGIDLPKEFVKLEEYKYDDLLHHISLLKDMLNQLINPKE